jgi:DNA topoisomerase II
MAIWSLTQERIDKLKKQIADKEVEIQELCKLTSKDIWTSDLDAFIEEWQHQLAEDEKDRKEMRRKGRRQSNKLGIGGKAGKSRKKKNDSDDDDSDFAISKAKKPAAKPSSMLSYLNKPAVAGPSKSSAVNALLGGAGSGTATDRVKDEDNDIVMVDGANDASKAKPVMSAAVAAAMAPPAKKQRGKPAAAPIDIKVSSKSATPIDIDDSEDVFAEVAKEEALAPVRRPGRAATKAAPKYALSDDDSEAESRDDFDVSTMVRGLGNGTSTTTGDRKLFSASARPTSSQGLSRNVGRISTKPISPQDDDSMDIDNTDFVKLAPVPSPERPAARPNNLMNIASDDESDALAGLAKPKASIMASKLTAKPISKPVVKPMVKAATKPTAKPTAKTVAKPTTVVAAKEKLQLSPAAKAYASKQEKIKAALSKPTGKKQMAFSDSEDEQDDTADKIAQDLLTDESESDELPVLSKTKATKTNGAKKAAPVAKAAAPAGRARPGRAATKPVKYVDSDEDEDEDDDQDISMEDSFVVDDDSD